MSDREDRIRREADATGRARRCPGASSSGADGRGRSAGSRRARGARRVRERPDSSSAAELAAGKSRRDLELDELHGPSLKKSFPKDTGIELTYDEDINDNNEYFAKIRPNLSKNQSIGRDGFVLTDWMANRMINQVKWVEPLDRARRSRTRRTCAHALAVTRRSTRPRKFSVPWASGVTGIAYNIEITGKEIKHDRRLPRGRAARRPCSREMRDTVGLFMRRSASTPPSPTYADGRARVRQAREGVQRRQDRRDQRQRVRERPRRREPRRGFAWSGDVAQITQGQPGRRASSVPDSGGDALVRQLHDPEHAPTRPTSRPSSSTSSTTRRTRRCSPPYIQYISPVDGVADELHDDGRRRGEARRQPAREPDRRVPRRR